MINQLLLSALPKLNYQSTRIVCGVAFAAVFFLQLPLWCLLLPTGISVGLIIYGSFNIQANYFTHAYCSQNTTEKVIALTFDDGPHRQYTPQVLALLARYQSTATFFVIGKNIHGNEALLKQMIEAGHSIGNHSYTHANLVDFNSLQGFKNELNQTTELVAQAINKRMQLFRPPYGVTTPTLVNALQQLNYYCIGWNIRSLDTTHDSEQTISRRVQTQLKPGAIILLHDTSHKSIQVLENILAFASVKGYRMVSVEQLLNLNAYVESSLPKTDFDHHGEEAFIQVME